LGGAVIGFGYYTWSKNRMINDKVIESETLKNYMMTGFWIGGACRIAMLLPGDLRTFLKNRIERLMSC
jgi:hypothetical protein